MHTINVFPFPITEYKESCQNHSVVVIDSLRASATIITALDAGAKGIIPVSEPEQAMLFRDKYSPEPVLLSGERAGEPIEGFDLGNSPLEYTPEKVAGKNIIMCSTNGTKAVLFAAAAEHLYIGTYLNLTAVIEKLLSSQEDMDIVCAGQINQLCLEDIVCAGAIINGLASRGVQLSCSDAATASRDLYQTYKTRIGDLLWECSHGRYLASLGYEKDLDYCSQIDISNRVPHYENGVILP